MAEYYDIAVDGKVNKGAAWHYPTPKAAAQKIKGHVAFWKGVRVVKGDGDATAVSLLARLKQLLG